MNIVLCDRCNNTVDHLAWHFDLHPIGPLIQTYGDVSLEAVDLCGSCWERFLAFLDDGEER